MHCSDKQNKGVVLHMKKKKQHPICSVLLNYILCNQRRISIGPPLCNLMLENFISRNT